MPLGRSGKAHRLFPWVHAGGRPALHHPRRFADTVAMETHVHARLLERRGTSFGETSQRKALVGTAEVLALRAWLPRFGLAAFDALVAMTGRIKHGHAYHDTLLLMQAAAWHTGGKMQICNTTCCPISMMSSIGAAF